MPRYKVFPEGYDPMIASGPPTQDNLDMDISWSPEDTARMLELEKQATVSDYKPVGRWTIILEETDG